jgi:hypothetical protein
VLEEHASGGDRDRLVLAQVLAWIKAGDTLVVVSLDRLARSLSHLLSLIEGTQACGAFPRVRTGARRRGSMAGHLASRMPGGSQAVTALKIHSSRRQT